MTYAFCSNDMNCSDNNKGTVGIDSLSSCPLTTLKYYKPAKESCMVTAQGEYLCGVSNDNFRYGENVIVAKQSISKELKDAVKYHHENFDNKSCNVTTSR